MFSLILIQILKIYNDLYKYVTSLFAHARETENSVYTYDSYINFPSLFSYINDITWADMWSKGENSLHHNKEGARSYIPTVHKSDIPLGRTAHQSDTPLHVDPKAH